MFRQIVKFSTNSHSQLCHDELSFFAIVPPKIIRSPVQFLKVDEGASLEMDCLAIGHPTPETTWLVQGHRQTFDDNWPENAQTVMEAFAKFGGSKSFWIMPHAALCM